MLARPSSAIRLFLLLGSLLSVAGQRLYTIVNKCPDLIYIQGGEGPTSIPSKQSITTAAGVDTDFYASPNGHVDDSIRVGFYGGATNLYYIVKNWDSFNIGVSVQPNHPQVNGFCPPITCNAKSCTTAFLGFADLNNPSVPPKPPLYSCPFPNVLYTITLCPSGSYPSDDGRAAVIHPNGNQKKCMDVRGAVYANGTPVQIYDCNGTGAQKWVYTRLSTQIRVANTNYCLDSSNPPTRDGVGMKIWTCYKNLPAQEWTVDTYSNWPIQEGTGYCLDLPNGVLTNWNQLQVWRCAGGNTNQLWSKGP